MTFTDAELDELERKLRAMPIDDPCPICAADAIAQLRQERRPRAAPGTLPPLLSQEQRKRNELAKKLHNSDYVEAGKPNPYAGPRVLVDPQLRDEIVYFLYTHVHTVPSAAAPRSADG